jgi:hypothetical protein
MKRRIFRQDRKAQDLESLAGIILGIVLLFGFVMLLSNCTSRSAGERSFDEFSQALQVMASAQHGESDSFILELDDETAVVGFNPVSKTPNGRFGDGDVQYLMSDNARADIGYGLTRMDILTRPSECPKDKACICRLREPDFNPFTQPYIGNYPSYTTMGKTDYTRFDNPYFLPSLSTVKDFFNHDPFSQQSSAVIVTWFGVYKKASCMPLESSFPSVSLQPLFVDMAPDYGLSKPFFAFEDGFIIFNPGSKDGGYQNRKPALGYRENMKSLALKYGKLQDGTIGVCITDGCFDVLEKNVRMDKDYVAKLVAAQAAAAYAQANIPASEAGQPTPTIACAPGYRVENHLGKDICVPDV